MNIKEDPDIDVKSLFPTGIPVHLAPPPLLQCTRRIADYCIETNTRNDADKKYACSDCSKEYQSRAGLYSHQKFKHPLNPIEVRCSICAKKYSSLLSFQKHYLYMHSYEYRCDACSQTFPTKYYICRHIKEDCTELMHKGSYDKIKRKRKHQVSKFHKIFHHKNDKFQYICGICKNEFHSFGELWAHVDNYHSDLSIEHNYVL